MRELDRAVSDWFDGMDLKDGDVVEHVIRGWQGLFRGRSVVHPNRVSVERSPSWRESVSPEYLRHVEPC